MTPQFAALVPLWYARQRRGLDPITAATALTGFTRADICGASRKASICRVRFAIMAAYRRRGYSLPRIGMIMGGRDHTTIMHGIARAAELRATDDAFCKLVASIA